MFNCDNEVDLRSLVWIFKGIIINGYFGCLDEFNRLSIDCLIEMGNFFLKLNQARVGKKETLDF